MKEAILEAYPNSKDLEVLLAEEMDIQFEAIASGSSYNNQVFKLIEHFCSIDSLEDFINVLVKSRPKNAIFQGMSPKPIAEAVSGDRPDSPEGQMGMDSRFYIHSNYEQLCYEEVKKPGSLIRIKSPENMGKSSLMLRVLGYAEELGYRTVNINLEQVNQKFFEDLDKFMQWFCASAGKQMGVRVKIEEYWDDIFAPNDNTTEYFEKYLLKGIETPLVVAIDNFDRVFNHADIETDFCDLLRGWFEKSRSAQLWGNLRLIIVHSRESYLPKDINRSPFNVGLPIELGEFNPNQIQELVSLHGLDWKEQQLGQLIDLIGGHPYLVRLALYRISIGDLTFEQFLKTAPTEQGIYKDHLLRYLEPLEDYPDLGKAMKTVVTSKIPVRLSSEEAFKLDSMGLVVRVENNVQPRCRLYSLYFGNHLEG